MDILDSEMVINDDEYCCRFDNQERKSGYSSDLVGERLLEVYSDRTTQSNQHALALEVTQYNLLILRCGYGEHNSLNCHSLDSE